MDMSAREVVLGIAGSGTPLEKEYRLVCDGLGRTETLVTVFDEKRYDARAVTTVRDQWLQRMGAEHRSTTVFSNLAAQLIEANATLDAKVVMLRMAQDELRHTETCGEVVRAMGGEPRHTMDVTVAPLALHRGCSLEERAMRNVLYTTCLSEMVAVARLVDELDSTEDPFLRDATRRLLADEVLHGQFGFHYLEAWRPWLEVHPEVITSLGRYLTHAFAVLEAALAGAPVASATRGPVRAAAPPRPRALTADERALGLSDDEKARDIFYGTIEGAVVPGLDRFGIDATGAWKNRRFLEGGEVPARPV